MQSSNPYILRSTRLRAATVCTLAATLVFAAFALPGRADAQSGPRIVNGLETQAEYTTGAMLVISGGSLRENCSGTMIGCQTYLTAAHCVCSGDTAATCGTPDPNDYKIYLQNQGILDVTAIDVHPGYEFAVAHDIAVFTLTAPVNGISPTPINTDSTPAFGTAGTIVGYGLTLGNTDEAGLKRTGSIVSTSCSGSVPESAHVCWAFTNPLGVPGTDSNTCSGDSGGPLFMDIGSGTVVAGVTSGGNSNSCLPVDLSFDANVFDSAAFIQSIGGVDLNNTTCGASNQVGSGGNTIDVAFSSMPPGKTAAKCRKIIRKHHTKYATSVQKLQQKCLDGVGSGKIGGPCPDAATATKIAAAASKVDPIKIEKKCPASVVPVAGTALGCGSAANASDLAVCIIAAADAAVASALDVEYADTNPAAQIPAASDAACQAAIGKALGKYTKTVLKTTTKCQSKDDLGKISGSACPDSKAAEKLDKATDKVEPGIGKKCDDSNISALDGAGTFGGSCAGSTDVSGFATCAINEHNTITAGLTGLVNDVTGSLFQFDVASPTATALIVALNGIDVSGNDIDLYLRQGSAPTTSTFDQSSAQGGVFEDIVVPTPAVGTYFVLVDQPSAGTSIAFQLTATLLDN